MVSNQTVQVETELVVLIALNGTKAYQGSMIKTSLILYYYYN